MEFSVCTRMWLRYVYPDKYSYGVTSKVNIINIEHGSILQYSENGRSYVGDTSLGCYYMVLMLKRNLKVRRVSICRELAFLVNVLSQIYNLSF